MLCRIDWLTSLVWGLELSPGLHAEFLQSLLYRRRDAFVKHAVAFFPFDFFAPAAADGAGRFSAAFFGPLETFAVCFWFRKMDGQNTIRGRKEQQGDQHQHQDEPTVAARRGLRSAGTAAAAGSGRGPALAPLGACCGRGVGWAGAGGGRSAARAEGPAAPGRRAASLPWRRRDP